MYSNGITWRCMDCKNGDIACHVNNGITWICKDCGSADIGAYVNEGALGILNDPKLCHHAHPLGPPGRIIFSHPKGELCEYMKGKGL